jgi:hypothetical protein
MKTKIQTFSNKDWFRLINEMHGALELLRFEHTIIGTSTTHNGGMHFYGVIFYEVMPTEPLPHQNIPNGHDLSNKFASWPLTGATSGLVHSQE